MRGYQRKVIFLKDTGSHLFDEAYFVVSRKGEDAGIGKGDMILEANRIKEIQQTPSTLQSKPSLPHSKSSKRYCLSAATLIFYITRRTMM